MLFNEVKFATLIPNGNVEEPGVPLAENQPIRSIRIEGSFIAVQYDDSVDVYNQNGEAVLVVFLPEV